MTPDVWLLTLAAPHAAGDGPALTVETLYAAHERFLRSRAWRAFCRRFGVASTVRALDATFGGRNGAHPHFHLLVFPSAATVTGEERRDAARFVRDPSGCSADEYTRRLARARERRALAADPCSSWTAAALPELDREERAEVLARFEVELRLAWSAALVEVGEERPTTAAALRLSPGEDAGRYLVSWGLGDEVGAAPIKSRSFLRLLDAAAAGVVDAGPAWREWREATAGRAWVTGLRRAMRRMGVDDAAVAAHRKDQQRKRDNEAERLWLAGLVDEPRRYAPITITVPSYLWREACTLGLDQVERLAAHASERGWPVAEVLIDTLLALRRSETRIRDT